MSNIIIGSQDPMHMIINNFNLGMFSFVYLICIDSLVIHKYVLYILFVILYNEINK